MRVKAVIAYDGSSFSGFQKQKSTKRTVTYAIEETLRSLHINSAIVGSGRTDTGVHASAQVIHFDLPYFWKDLAKLKRSLNRKLSQVFFKHITEVPEDFHARFSAKKRLYRYIFKTRTLSVFERNYISHSSSFDPQLLQTALHCFEGEHDFKYFYKTGTETHTCIRKIYKSFYRSYGGYHLIYFQANGFLRAQVRMMVDAALQCSKRELTLEALKEQIQAKQQHSRGLAAAQGLYLARIIY